MPPKKTKEKKYIVLYEKTEAWIIGTKQDIIDDFNQEPDAYLGNDDNLEIYELGEPIKFGFVTPKILF
jgi:hypothetical protein